MIREFYFEARDKSGTVFIGHVRAADEEEARRQARQRYPYALSLAVRLVG